ncbi:acetate kinase [Pseudolactococcus carnosus]|uniref:acetate kinase n=1 Tax=Pseudolactococcus carnosus TaxID=2749961 RepID=UPI00081278DB|nr:acetate kinase [Lactococcus carnosus]SCA92628.1 Acetate kinase 1 [Lactococcus piscium]MCJ1969371.1 acetate kinase [Lactococcus carnosus]MCJ1973238.1 acetate kinase [Lactococcus carnosus]MCJ1975333.1 acetate kinase [Lactococcus carnosus]MCJ1979007.1 acetate kinase [Lactococcus carnosus]
MSKTIAINAGSSSLKWQLYEMPEETVIAKGLIERIGLPESVSTVSFAGDKQVVTKAIHNHTEAVSILMNDLKALKIIEHFSEITGTGHRVVAGGELFNSSVLITDEVAKQIEELSDLAPLHNPANVAGIHAFRALLPNATHVAVFDTAFHSTMPPVAFRYPVPNAYYDQYAVRKYGAHGTSHMYVAQKAADYLGKSLEDLKLITAHIGNGGSLTAIAGGKSIDTSMGFTPLAGIMMGTRTGELDASIIPYIMAKTGITDVAEVIDVFNKKSGLAGISELSSDMRDIIKSRDAGDEKAALAFDMFVDRIQKYIGQYLAVLNGADAIVFTAGIGENSFEVRKAVIDGLSWFGLDIDDSKNVVGADGIISTPNAKVKVLVIPTDEELVITRDVEKFK